MIKIIFNSPDIFLISLIIFLLVGYEFIAKDFVELSIQTYLHLIVFSLLFSIWYRSSKSLFDKLTTKTIKPFIPLNFLYAFALLLFFYSIWNAYIAYLGFDIQNLISFRSLISAEDNEFGERVSLKVGLSFPAIMAASHVANKNNSATLNIYFLAMGLLLAILSTSKIFILLWIIYSFTRENISQKRLIISVGLVFLIFSISHIVLKKFSSNPADGLIGALINTFFVYLFGALAAYDNLLTNSASIDPTSMFVGLKSFLELFFSISIPAESILPWTSIGRWHTNNYTAFGYWYAYMGTSYIFVMSGILGIYYGFFFSTTKFVSISFDFYKFFLILCIGFTIFGDHYIPALSMHLSYIFFSLFAALTKS